MKPLPPAPRIGYAAALLALTLNWAAVLSAQENAPAPAAEPAETGKTRSIIWKVSGENGNTVYLAGSVHLLREQDHPLPPTYDEVYEDSERIYYEVDMSLTESPESQMMLLQMGQYEDGQTIRDHVSEDTMKQLEAWFQKRGLGGPMLESMKPGMLSVTIGSMEAMAVGALPHLGVETVFHQKALRDGKPEKALETAEYQIGLFTKLTSEEQEELLRATLEQAEETGEMLGTLIEAWKKGDAEKLHEDLNKQFKEGDKLTRILLWDRNANWIPAIEKELKSGEGNAMFIVGAGHLVGKQSVIDLLEQRGYQPVQMSW